jgi:hypothetical protein
LGSDEDDNDEELALQSPLASAKGDASGTVCDNAYMHHDEVAPAELCGGLSATAADILRNGAY